jgi:hypothetical protein
MILKQRILLLINQVSKTDWLRKKKLSHKEAKVQEQVLLQKVPLLLKVRKRR